MSDLPARARRSDGEQTYATILETAVRLASVEGLEGLSIGRLAQEVGVSKSGLFAHFGSKRQLQVDVVQAARDIFAREVVDPALDGRVKPGLPRLQRLCDSYLSYVERRVFPGGCFFAGMLAEFDAREGSAHEAVAQDQRDWIELLAQLATEAQQLGELAQEADVPQLVFELTAALELANYYHVLFGEQAVIDRARHSIRSTLERTAPTGA